MPVLHKMYHRGNDDKKEGNFLTAIFSIKLNADTHMCCEIPTEQGKTCVGFVIFSFDIVIKSPEGRGNGNIVAAIWAPAYGVEQYGAFYKFDNAKPKGAAKEEWKIAKTLPLMPILCTGGAYKGSVVIRIADDEAVVKMAGGKANHAAYKGTAYSIEYSISVVACGKVKMDFHLKQGEKAFALDGGDPDMEIRKRALKEVKPGEKPPFGLHTAFPPTADMEVSETGEIITKK